MDNASAKRIREQNLASLQADGLKAANWMPLADGRECTELRPTDEILRRLMVSNAVVAWACAPEEAVPSQIIQDYIRNNSLASMMTGEEKEIVESDREDAEEFSDRVGWKTENEWSLAWVLGFDTAPDVKGEQIDTQISQQITFDFINVFKENAEDLLGRISIRPVEQVVELEDLFYCAHNAYRGMMLEGQGSIFATGVIEERRHALTWCLSPGVTWEETDLST